jgi:hypothetical protein
MTLLNQDGVPSIPSVNGSCVSMVEEMLKKDMSIISKLELCKLIVAQYSAIEELMDALVKVQPYHRLIPKSRRTLGPESGVSGTTPPPDLLPSGDVSDESVTN